MRYLLCLLFVISSVIAQPVDGPYVVVSISSTIDDIQIAARANGLVDVFYQTGRSIRHVIFDFDSESLAFGPESFTDPDSIYTRMIGGVYANTSGWFALVYDWEAEGSDAHYFTNRTTLLAGETAVNSETVIDAGWVHYYEVDETSHSNADFDLIARPGGGFFTKWIRHGAQEIPGIGAWEPFHQIILNAYDANGEFLYEVSRFWCYSFLYGPHFALICPIGGDSIAGITWKNYWNEFAFCRGDSSDSYDLLGYCELPDCTPMEYITTPLNRELFLCSVDSSLSVLELVDQGQEQTCEPVWGADIQTPILASLSDPQLGFAWLHTLGSGLYLSRLDADASPFVPPGVITWLAGNTWFGPATIDRIGFNSLVISWIERSGGTDIIKIASVGWDTFLDSEPERDASQPTSFSLTAYPNPFNITVSIAYELPVTGEISLIIYNLAGQEVATLVDGRQNAGQHSIDWTPQTTSGIYFANLKTGHEDCISKLVYIR